MDNNGYKTKMIESPSPLFLTKQRAEDIKTKGFPLEDIFGREFIEDNQLDIITCTHCGAVQVEYLDNEEGAICKQCDQWFKC